MSTHPLIDRLAGSPCCLPALPSEELLPAYRELGYRNYEAFSSWATCRHHWEGDPMADRARMASFGMAVTSYHLPPIGEDIETGLQTALAAARYASRLGDRPAVLFKANTREIFAQAGKRFLDAVESEGLNVVPVLQNHKGSAISTLEDYREVLESIDDSRIKCILEVGHFQRVGVSWEEGWKLLGDRIALIHVNEIRGGDSVPFGTGDVDFAGLMKQIRSTGYPGKIVVELELKDRDDAPKKTLGFLREAIEHVIACYDRS